MNEQEDETIGILGIGNLLLMDEGFGVHLVRYLEEQYRFPEKVQILDAGTSGIYMAPFIESVSYLLVVDVVDLQEEPGTIHRFSSQDIKNGLIPSKMSPHQLGLLEMLDICRLRDRAPKEVEFFCVVPEKLDTGICLSPRLTGKIKEVAEIISIELLERNILVSKK